MTVARERVSLNSPVGQIKVMRHHDRCQGEGFAQLPDKLENRTPGFGVKVAGGLIGQQNLGLHDQGPGQGDPLLLAAGKLAHFVGGAVQHPDPLQEIFRIPGKLGALLPGNKPGQENVFQGIELREQMVKLKNKTNHLIPEQSQLVIGFFKNIFAPVKKLPLTGLIKGAQDVQKGCFPGAGSADHRDHFPGGQPQIYPGKHLQAGVVAVFLVDIPRFKKEGVF